MTTQSIDLDAYGKRIGYTGSWSPSLETLRAIHALHPAAIPFENLSPFMAEAVPLDLESLEGKLVRAHRGGYCFEQNGLLLAVLRAIGFQVSGLAARVVWSQPEGTVLPRTHMLLRVELGDQTYIADVGFGGNCLTAPLRLEDGVAQETTHEPFRVVRTPEGEYRLEAELRGAWTPLYRFDLMPAFPADYEMGNYFVSTNPSSAFRTSLLIARTVPGRRFALRGRNFTVHELGGASDHVTLQSPADVLRALTDTFGIRLPDRPKLEQALERLFES